MPEVGFEEPKGTQTVKNIWEGLDSEPLEQQIGFPAAPSSKGRLESFETTDVIWTSKIVPLTDKAEVTGGESLETGLNEKGSPKKELRRFPSKVQDKIKNKIRKLKGFWRERARMMPHMFKLTFREEPDSYELHDLSLKGASGKSDPDCDGEGAGAPEGEEVFMLCDISRDLPLDFETL